MCRVHGKVHFNRISYVPGCLMDIVIFYVILGLVLLLHVIFVIYLIYSFSAQLHDLTWEDLCGRQSALNRIYFHEMQMSRFWANPDVD
ncbi:hypothetical protein Aduo_003193 [Ancylostoma duodenale]